MALIAGLVVALLVSVVAALPHYTSTKLSQTSGPGSYSAAGPVNGTLPSGSVPAGSSVVGNAAPAPGGAVNSAGGGSTTGGHYVGGQGGYTIPGTAGSGGTLGTTTHPTGTGQGSVDCAHGRNGGATAPGVTASDINVASTIVTSSVGSGFLGQAQDGIEAAFREQNNAGGVCGRQISFQSVNSGWNGPQGAADISSYIHSGSVFALVGQPDSEGLDQATTSGLIDSSGMPVVGTDGLLKSQYGDQWIWPVAAPTVVNMHIIASYAYSHFGATSASDYGIVYDSYYKFGAEGATAFDAEVHRLTGGNIPGYSGQAGCSPANQQYCGFDGQNAPTSEDINAFTAACNNKCKVVVMLLEPTPMEEWMSNVAGHNWYQHLFGGEPLFDDNLGPQCGGCANMIVWTGYHPAVQPFDSESAVAGYVNALHAVCPSCDAHNEFTEGAYIGAQLFIAALKVVAAQDEPLTRANLRAALDALTFNDGLTSSALGYSSALHLANTKMAAFSDNYSGTFNGWTYLNTGFVADPAAGQDL